MINGLNPKIINIITWAEKDIILGAVGSDDKSLVIYFQGWVLYEEEHVRANTAAGSDKYHDSHKSDTQRCFVTPCNVALQPTNTTGSFVLRCVSE